MTVAIDYAFPSRPAIMVLKNHRTVGFAFHSELIDAALELRLVASTDIAVLARQIPRGMLMTILVKLDHRWPYSTVG